MSSIKLKPRSKHAEWKILNRYFGNYEMSVMFRDFNGYKSVRENCTYQEVFDELEYLNYE